VFILKKKKIFSRTSRPNSIKLGTNHPEVKGIQNCTNQGPGPLQRGDNLKNTTRVPPVKIKNVFLQVVSAIMRL
jgi:hypothetical protein